MATVHIGKTFGELTVLDGYCRKTSGGFYKQYFTVQCSCGKVYDVDSGNVLRAKQPCCSACRKKLKSALSEIGYKHPLYGVWWGMVRRCHDFSAYQYRNYGDRGITVCARWRGACVNGEIGTIDGFHTFIEDMGPRPDGLTIERVDNNSGYCPENCKWATVLEQQNNRRNNVRVSYDGVTRTVSQWARVLGTAPGWAATATKYGVPLPDAIKLCLRADPTKKGKWQAMFGVTPKPRPLKWQQRPELTEQFMQELHDLFYGSAHP